MRNSLELCFIHSEFLGIKNGKRKSEYNGIRGRGHHVCRIPNDNLITCLRTQNVRRQKYSSLSSRVGGIKIFRRGLYALDFQSNAVTLRTNISRSHSNLNFASLGSELCTALF